MSKVTSKLQVTIPKAVAKAYGIEPGTEIVFESAGDAIRVHRVEEGASACGSEAAETEFRLRLFDEATERQRLREARQIEDLGISDGRGWDRADLYDHRDGRPA